MAEDRVFTLIGNFQDNITGSLKKVNKSLDSVNKQLERMISLTSPIKQDFKEMSQYAMQFNRALAGQNANLKRTNTALRQHAREIGRVNRAYKAGGSRFMVSPSVSPSRRGRGGKGGKGGGGGMASAVGGAVFGTQLANMMTGAIVAGFQAGTNIMMTPFRYIVNGMGERIRDEMSDVRAAGGLFAVNRLIQDQGKEGFIGSFREAEEVTKANNRYLAELAGSLPGDTQDYIQVSKQISDGIYRILAQDKDNFMKSAAQYAREEGRIEQARQIEAGGKEGMQAAGTEALGEITKLTVLAGLGGRQGAYGLPQLTERMLAQQDVSMGQMQRYAAIFRDPMIMGALERNIAKINETNANTADRMDAIRNMFKEVVTPELVARFRRTTEGVLESLKTTFMNPEVGLLGLGRPIKGLGKKIDDFGRYVDKQGNVVEDVTKAASADISIFEGLRDTFAFLYQTLEPIVEIIPLIFDPLKDLGIELSKIRDATAAVFRRFNEYRTFFEEMGGEFKDTARLRASMSTLTQLFKDFGIFDKATFDRIQGTITTSVEFGPDHAAIILKEMIDKFFDSDLAESIGYAIGTLIGTVIKGIGDLAAQASGIASASKLSKGVKDGFAKAGGPEGIQLIFDSLIGLILKALRDLFEAAPLTTMLVGGLAVFGPSIAGAIGTGLVGAIPKLLGGLLSGLGGGGGAMAGLAAIPIWGWVAALAAAVVVFEGPIMAFTGMIRTWGQKLQQSNNWLTSAFGHFVEGIAQVAQGITQFFNGLWEIVSGLLMGDSDRVVAGIKKLFQGIVNLFVGIGRTVGGMGGMIIGAAGNIFKAVTEVLRRARNWILERIGLGGLVNDTPTGQRPTPRPGRKNRPGGTPAEAKGSANPYYGSLGSAINYEMKNKPPGSSLVIANSSETIIPAARGYIPSRGSNSGWGGKTPMSINAPITIYQQPGQSSKELAAVLADELWRAVSSAQRSSLFV